jgi:peptidoglycan-N-acetylglucosamine deacetylase
MVDRIKPPAGISLDLDNLWSYMKIHGDRGWEKYPSYFSIFVPHVLDILDELDIRITFFIVGKDAEIDENKIYLKMITDRGHDVGNHSHNHDPWLQSYSLPEIEKEIEKAEESIFRATGHKTRGFRGPGFSWSVDLLKVLKKKGYMYDSSSLPTWLGPLARKYYFWKADLSDQEKEDRKELFGKFTEGFRPLKPYYLDTGNGKGLLEIPVTTIPLLRVPFHLSYLLYISRFSPMLMRAYLNKALLFCKITGVSPVFLLHPLDIIGGDKISELSFFPGMDIPSDQKVKVFKQVLGRIKSSYRPLTMHDFSMGMKKANLKTLTIR